jgi:hypothetical protein
MTTETNLSKLVEASSKQERPVLIEEEKLTSTSRTKKEIAFIPDESASIMSDKETNDESNQDGMHPTAGLHWYVLRYCCTHFIVSA